MHIQIMCIYCTRTRAYIVGRLEMDNLQYIYAMVLDAEGEQGLHFWYQEIR
jgi:hypothetical protein